MNNKNNGNNRSLSIQIKHYRSKGKFKQKDVADFLGIPLSTYSNYENNHRAIPTHFIVPLAELFGIDTSTLLQEEGLIDNLFSFSSIEHDLYENHPDTYSLYQYLKSHTDSIEQIKENGADYLTVTSAEHSIATYTVDDLIVLDKKLKDFISYEIYKKSTK